MDWVERWNSLCVDMVQSPFHLLTTVSSTLHTSKHPQSLCLHRFCFYSTSNLTAALTLFFLLEMWSRYIRRTKCIYCANKRDGHNVWPVRTSCRKVLRESSESELRTERDRQEVSAVRAARPAASIFSLAVWNTCEETTSTLKRFLFAKRCLSQQIGRFNYSFLGDRQHQHRLSFLARRAWETACVAFYP